jgi:geranylgeranyl diphosphate synthase, type I
MILFYIVIIILSDIMEIINIYKKEIEFELKKFLNSKCIEAKKVSSQLYSLIRIFENFTLRGGKRLRGILTILSYTGCNKKKSNDIIKIAAAIEILHSFLLVHDDIMDDDSVRRNGLTVHKAFENKYDSSDIGKALSIVIGDIAQSYAIELILSTSFNDSVKLNVITELNSMIKKCCYGQLMDVMGGILNVNEFFIKNIHQYKTAYYSVAGPMGIGALLAKADKNTIKNLTEIGIKIGLAFQLRDDILGVFGSQKEIGKPVGSDLIQGKKTMLILKSKSVYVNKKIGSKLKKNEIIKIRNIIRDSGSLNYSENLINKLLTDAKLNLKNSNLRLNEKKIFMYLVDYLETRNS